MKRFTSSAIVLVLFLCSSTVLPVELFGAPPTPDPELQKMQAFQVREKEGIKYFGKGRLENGEARLVLHVKGSHYEMGYQQGILLEDIISNNIRRNLRRVQI